MVGVVGSNPIAPTRHLERPQPTLRPFLLCGRHLCARHSCLAVRLLASAGGSGTRIAITPTVIRRSGQRCHRSSRRGKAAPDTRSTVLNAEAVIISTAVSRARASSFAGARLTSQSRAAGRSHAACHCLGPGASRRRAPAAGRRCPGIPAPVRCGRLSVPPVVTPRRPAQRPGAIPSPACCHPRFFQPGFHPSLSCQTFFCRTAPSAVLMMP